MRGTERTVAVEESHREVRRRLGEPPRDTIEQNKQKKLDNFRLEERHAWLNIDCLINPFTFRFEERQTYRDLSPSRIATDRHAQSFIVEEITRTRDGVVDDSHRDTRPLMNRRREVNDESRNRQLILPRRRDQSRRFQFETVWFREVGREIEMRERRGEKSAAGEGGWWRRVGIRKSNDR